MDDESEFGGVSVVDTTLTDNYAAAPSFGVGAEEEFSDDPVPAVLPPAPPIPAPPGFPEFSLPGQPALPNFPQPKLELPGVALPAIPNGSLANLVPSAPTELFDKVKNDIGDLKPEQKLSQATSVLSFPSEPQAISKDIAKVAPSVSQDLVQEVIKNTTALFSGFFVPNAGVLEMITGVTSQALAIGSQALSAYGQAVSLYTAGIKTKEQLEEALKNGFGGVINQLAGITGTRQVPTGLRNPLSSTVPEHELATDKANRADWPNGSNVPADPLAALGNSVRMVEDSRNLAAGLASAEKATAVMGRSYSMLAQGLAKPALGLQLDGMLRLHTLNSVNVKGSATTNASLLKEHQARELKTAIEQGGSVEAGSAKGTLSGSVEGTCTGTVAGASVSGQVSGSGSGTLSGQITAQVGKASISGGSVQPDGSITGATLAVQSLQAVDIAGTSGTVSLTGSVTGSAAGNFAGAATGTVAGALAGSYSGTVAANGTQAPAVVKNTTVSNLSGTGSVAGDGTVTASGVVSGSVSGQLSEGSVTGAEVSSGTVVGASITNPVYGIDGSLEGGTVSGTAQGVVASGGTITGSVSGTATGSFTGSGLAEIQGRANVEISSGTVSGGTCLLETPDSASAVKTRLAALKGRAVGSMPGNILELGYGDAPATLTGGYLQALPGRIADNLGSSNGRLIDEYMTSPAEDLDSITPLLPDLLLPGNDVLQQLVLALRTLQELVLYLEALPVQTTELMQQKITQVGSDFLSFVQVIRIRAPEFGDRTKLAKNYLRRGFTYEQRQLVRLIASLWDNLQTNPATVLDPTLLVVVERVMGDRKKVFNR